VSSILERDDAIDSHGQGGVVSIFADIPDPMQACHAVAVEDELLTATRRVDGPGPASVNLAAVGKRPLDTEPAPDEDVVPLSGATVEDEPLSAEHPFTPLPLSDVLAMLSSALVPLDHPFTVLAGRLVPLLSLDFSMFFSDPRRVRAPRLCKRRCRNG
jgi:hypothetical protein